MTQARSKRRALALSIKKGKKYSIPYIKYTLDYEFNKRLIEIVPKASLNKLLSHPLPKTINELDQSKTYYNDGNLNEEIDWYFLRIHKYYDEINKFLSLKSIFEIELLNGNFAKCETLINNIENDICYSHWGLQAKLLLAELKSGTEANRILLKQIQNQNISPNLKIILYYNSLRLEADIPSNKYESYIDFHLKKHSTSYSQKLFDYANFKFFPFKHESKNSFDLILNQDFSLSVIDSYIELKKILSLIISAENSTFTKEYIENRIPDIRLLINDNFWDKILNTYVENPISSDYDDKSFKIALKHLAKNEINECLDFIAKELNSTPDSYNLYQIFVEALSLSDRKLIEFIKDDSILFLVLNNLFQVIKKEQNHSDNIEGISKLAYMFDICDFHLPLISLYYSEKHPSVPQKMRSKVFLLNKAFSIYDAGYFENDIDFSSGITNRSFIDYKLKIDYYIQKSNYEYSLKLLDLIDQNDTYLKTIYYETWYNRKRLHSLIELDYIGEATELVVNYFIKHNRIFPSLYSQKLVDKIIELDGEPIFKHIYIPILYFIYNLSSNDIYDSIANFLIQNNISSISKTKTHFKYCNTDMLYFFLHRVCTINNIQDSPYLNTIEKVEKERIIILTQIKEINSNFENEVNKEIFDITQKATVRDCLQNIYDSRIYVDTNGVKKYLNIEIGDYFERYTNIVDFSFQDYSLFVFNQGQEDETQSKLLTYISYFNPPISNEQYHILTILSESNVDWIHPNKVEVPYSRFLAFNDIFEIVKDEFLFNEDYGLKFFLSMRIRHGTLPNFLNNVFEKHQLLLNEGINKENIINYWIEKISDSYQVVNKNLFIKALELFTKEIGDITNEGVSWVKIKENEHDKQSMFNIGLSEHDLYYSFRNRLGHIKSFDVFIEEVYDILWAKVNNVLIDLKNRFTSELLTKYIASIDKLQNEADTIFGEDNLVFFNDILVSTKTDIQNAIQKSLNWFNISKTKSIGEIPIHAVIQTSKEYLNILNADVFEHRIICSEKITFKPNIKGEYFILFCDFFNTILGNVIKHTEGISQPKCDILIEGNNLGGLNILVKNNTTQKYTKEVIEEWNKLLNDNKENYDASFEGKSGFLKMKKLLASDKIFKDYSFQLSSSKNIFSIKIVFKQKLFTI